MCMKNTIYVFTYFRVAKEGRPRTMTSAGGKRGIVFREIIRPGELVSKRTGDFVKEMLWGGYRSKTQLFNTTSIVARGC